MKDAIGPIAVIGAVILALYLISKALNKAAPSSPLQPLFDFGDLLSNAGNQTVQFLNQYEFNAPTGDPNDPSNVVIPTM